MIAESPADPGPGGHPPARSGTMNVKRCVLSAGLFFLIAGCTPATSTQTAPSVRTDTPKAVTNIPVSSETTASSLTPPAAGSSCTVLQDLNLRSGPGTAYNPPLAILHAGANLIPGGYRAQGLPGGSWVQVQVVGSNQSGWVSAGTQFVSCNLELASLPDVDVPPPPKPPLPKIGSGAVDGSNLGSFRYSLEYDPGYFLRMYVFRSDDPDEGFSASKDGRGITSVEFTVATPDSQKIFYDRTENTSGYCALGGGEPDCNTWIVEDGQYKWKAGGDPVVKGEYLLTITVNAKDGEVGVWLIPITLDFP